jgi:hypothetical protein
VTNTHFVDDDVSADDETDETDPCAVVGGPPARAWPLEALATAPTRPIEALVPLPRQRRFRSVHPHEERVVPPAPSDARDERGWG